MLATNIGQKIKKLRKEKGYTIKNMSEYTGLSVGYLSTLEQEKTSPTVANLLKIGSVLGIQLNDILMEEKEKKMVIRKDEAEVVAYPQFNQTLRIYDFGYEKQNYEHLTVEPGEMKENPEFRHPYSEMGVVLSGELVVTIEGVFHHLKPGDSIFIPQHMIHVMHNPGKEKSESFWVIGIIDK